MLIKWLVKNKIKKFLRDELPAMIEDFKEHNDVEVSPYFDAKTKTVGVKFTLKKKDEV